MALTNFLGTKTDLDKHPGSSVSVLYVDDEEGLLNLGKVFLERSGGFRVDTIPSAVQALKLPHLHTYDAIVSDYQMPGMDGIAFLKEIRSSHGNIPFILFTGRGREEVVIEAINNGADFYIQKGGDPKAQFAELGHKIHQAVSRWRTEHSLIESEKRLSDIINFLPDATFAINREGIIIAWNQAIEEMTGFSSEQMLGKGNLEYAIPFYGERRKILIDLIFESDDVVARRYSHIIHEKNVLIAETSLPRPKNEVVTLMGKASPLYNSTGEIVGAIESIRDISNLKKAEEELRKQLDLLAIREQQIRDSETKFRAVFELSYEALMLVEDERLVDCNDIAIHLFGYDSLEDIAGMRPYDSSPPFQPDGQDSMIGAANHIRAAFENGKEQFEWVHMKKDGSVFPAEVFLSTFEINGKKYMQSSIRDITERKMAENALRESEEKFRQLITLVPFPLCLVHADSSIEYINNRFVQTFGYTIKDIPTLQEWWQSAYPDEKYREWALLNWTQSLERAAERQSDIDPAEYRVTCKDGSVRNVIISGITMKEKFLATFLDVTEWRSVEKALQESEERYRTIVENIEDVFFRVDAEDRITMASASSAPLFGYDSVDEICGRSIFIVWKRSEDRALFLDAMKRQGGAVKDFEAEFVRKDGTSLWVSISSHLIIDGHGSFLGTEGIFHDITERKKAEIALILANKKLNLLSSITRHDITNQLGALSGFLELSKDTLPDPTRTAEFIAREERIVQTITRQIRFTKDYEDMGVKAPSWQNVAAVVRDVMTGLPVQDITLEIKTDNLEIFADPLLKQVFYNLLDNSLRYGETLSHIDVFYEKEEEDLILVWEDNGIGIRKEEKEKIFERGFGKHTGLGMFLVREILSLTDIMITENGNPGTGARFEMKIPRESYRF